MKIRIRFARTAAERAELASDKTDIRKIDIAIHYIADDVAHEFAAQIVRRNQQCQQRLAQKKRRS